MFIYNLKIKGKKIAIVSLICIFLIVVLIFSVSINKIFIKPKINNSEMDKNNSNDETSCIKKNEFLEIDVKNYTNILQAVNDDIDSYIGCKLHFSGYVYRLLDFEPNQFVLARDMLISDDKSQTLVVGFLCSYDDALSFEDGTWVDLTGIITKEEFHGEIPLIKVDDIKKIDVPSDIYVYPPDRTYIPTNFMF